MKVAIASAVLDRLLEAAAASPEAEVCGLLTGTPGTVTHAELARNVAPRPERGFEIDPATLLRVHREARGRGEAVVGHYHSHPNGRAEPSRTDAARALRDGQLWVIVAGGAATGWTMTADGFAPVELVATVTV